VIGIEIRISIGFDSECILDYIWDKAQDISNNYSTMVYEDYASGVYIIRYEHDDNESKIDDSFFDFASILNKEHLKYEVQKYEGS
jgi:hypothetical protein